jgi:hypothetical protein
MRHHGYVERRQHEGHGTGTYPVVLRRRHPPGPDPAGWFLYDATPTALPVGWNVYDAATRELMSSPRRGGGTWWRWGSARPRTSVPRSTGWERAREHR